MNKVTNIKDLRILAQKRLPRALFDYIDRGSYTESTLISNTQAFESINLRQRVGVDVSNRNLNTKMLNHNVAMPVAIAPTGLTGLNYKNGEIVGALCAEKFGIPFTLSTMSICSIEDVSEAVNKPFWFQLYVMKDRVFVKELIDRAKNAKVSALMITMDLQTQGQRHMDIKNGLSVPLKLTLDNATDMIYRIPWALNIIGSKRKSFGNLDGFVKDTEGLNNLARWIGSQFDETLSWADINWIKSQWQGKIILKGILDVDDAIIAANLGVDAIVISNHGGRQLDGACATINTLEAIVNAVGDRVEVFIDGGIQSGQDVYKCMALGAKGCLIGKSWLYGLGAGGDVGVTKCLDIIRKELDVTMALTGVNNVQDINKNNIILHQTRKL